MNQKQELPFSITPPVQDLLEKYGLLSLLSIFKEGNLRPSFKIVPFEGLEQFNTMPVEGFGFTVSPRLVMVAYMMQGNIKAFVQCDKKFPQQKTVAEFISHAKIQYNFPDHFLLIYLEHESNVAGNLISKTVKLFEVV